MVSLWWLCGSHPGPRCGRTEQPQAQRRLGEGGAPSPYPLPPGETGTRGLTEEILGRVLLVVSVLWEVIDFLAHPSEGPCGDETDRVLSLGPPRRGEGAPSAPGRPHETRLPQDADGGARRAGVGRVAEAWHCLPPRLCQILESARSAESYEADSFARRPVPPSSLPQLGRSGEKGSRVLQTRTRTPCGRFHRFGAELAFGSSPRPPGTPASGPGPSPARALGRGPRLAVRPPVRGTGTRSCRTSPWGNGRHFASSSSTSARLNAVVGECGVANAPGSGGSDRSAGSCPRRTVPDLLAADGVRHGVTASGPRRRRQRAGARRLAAAWMAGEGQSHAGLGARSGARAV